MNDSELKEAIGQLKGWELVDSKLHKRFSFSSFSEAFGFMTRVALEAEKMNHHPDWTNNYNRVLVDLFTHDAGRVTELDVQLARHMDQINS
ncbi:MAG: 4a-hydroxytetrahydrobiopterin dehydratase [Bdellovibrionales bacterium]|nr:4a-hydroxytetrahydrobiopterin dehydratase [Bdellovibrionales bacterium]